jgi:hypothetical protein
MFTAWVAAKGAAMTKMDWARETPPPVNVKGGRYE